MNELLSDEKLTVAELADPLRSSTTGVGEPAVAEAGTALPPDPGSELGTDPGPDRMAEPRVPQHVAVRETTQSNPLFPEDELQSFRLHWDKVQTSFVDEPRASVEQADSLVANVVVRIAEQFAAEREQLEKQWDRGENVDTEDLRQALKRYRAFFDRLLAF